MNCPQLLLELIFFSWTAATTNGHFWSLALLIGLWGAMKQLAAGSLHISHCRDEGAGGSAAR